MVFYRFDSIVTNECEVSAYCLETQYAATEILKRKGRITFTCKGKTKTPVDKAFYFIGYSCMSFRNSILVRLVHLTEIITVLIMILCISVESHTVIHFWYIKGRQVVNISCV